jgi:hypothetical protein
MKLLRSHKNNTIDKRINKGMLNEGISERKIPHTENPPEAWP